MRPIRFRVYGENNLEKGKEMHYFDLSEAYHYCHLPIMQYTGLKDSKGVEIYEGDLLECPNNCRCVGECGHDHTPTHEAVYWNAEWARWGAGWHTGLKKDYTANFMKVVGNIHENKELLDAI